VQASLSLAQARRIALAAQGLEKERPTGPVSARAVGRTFARLHLVQIDSVNVVTRTISISTVMDPNCGYRSLDSGIPDK